MKKRERLPNRRSTVNISFEYSGQHWILNIGKYDDGRLAEVFAQSSKSTSEMAAMARDAAILTSIALQHGVPIEVMQSGVTRLHNGDPASIAGRMLDELYQFYMSGDHG